MYVCMYVYIYIYIYIYIYKIIGEESQNFMLFATNSFTHRCGAIVRRLPWRSNTDSVTPCQGDRIQILLHPNKNANYLTGIDINSQPIY